MVVCSPEDQLTSTSLGGCSHRKVGYGLSHVACVIASSDNRRKCIIFW